ncbi:helix-turn-helix domain-containing protein [Devosia neptuniae]|uniref:helix-turn-helix domain-containing protein n=1 Tax=Devosia neptuniae TaxID=191302 RepID=UPI0022AF7215|nr:helix-turn-helix domain-containing protein [Devosia neptuniae]MCZ4348172.1 helix-turn-helix domain-containing protein [Devosia neptuniae]
MQTYTSSLLPTGGTGEASSQSRDRTPVRRQSRFAGRCEAVFWRSTNRQEVRQIVLAARKYDLAGKGAGARNGPLGGVAIEILDLMANLVHFRSGRLDPSIEHLMGKLKRSRDAIVRALKALRTHGFIDWLRRYVPTGNQSGPQVQQTSNAYRMSLPRKALQLLGRLGRPAPAPDDFSHAQEIRKAMLDAHQASLKPEELPLFVVEDAALAATLARLGKAMSDRKERESAKQTESQSKFLI